MHTHVTFFKHNIDDVVLYKLKFKLMQHQNISVVHITYKVDIAIIDIGFAFVMGGACDRVYST